ncbi:hypothetical protein VKT23_020090 [Stygiomarasmius scandens]|uniref:Uncharacterized protein n=1 Tax=Marasmiellus scandens TaxID=2682957 RepID=A0ABR1IL64_9AGAR
MVAATIRADIDSVDEYFEKNGEDEPDAEPVEKHYSLGFKAQPIRFQDLENMNQSKPSFSQFQLKLGTFMTSYFHNHNIPLPNGAAISLGPEEMITPFQYIKVNYESAETWRMETDRLCCNPNFFGKPHYDFVIFKHSEANHQFSQLLYVFVCTIDHKPYHIALVEPYEVVRNWLVIDKKLGLIWICQKAQKVPLFIPVASIIRGVVAPVVNETSTDCFVMDVLDGDMFLRMKTLYPGFTDIA